MDDAAVEGLVAVTFLEAARITGIPRSALYEHRKRGTLLSRRLGKRSVIMIEDLRAFVASLPVG